MERSDLESYEYQLAQIKQAYAADPTNADLITLKQELEDLIKLTKEYLAAAEGEKASANAANGGNAAASSSKPKAAPSVASVAAQSKKKAAASLAASEFKAGDEILGKYTDGRWYPARIVSISGSVDAPIFLAVFKGYNTTEQLSLSDVKVVTIDKKRQLEATADDMDKEKRRKKNVKKEETRIAKTAEQVGKQQAWQSFAKKSTKKGVSIPGLQGESMFKSPDSPYGRVGVVGSGAKMSEFQDKKRHVFEADDAA